MTDDNFRTARQIAVELGTYKRAVHRKARREQWPVQKAGNCFLYRVPRSLRRRLAPAPQPAAGGSFPPAISPAERARLRRAWFRFEAICALEDLLASGAPRERTLRQVAGLFSSHASPTSLRKWRASYHRAGFLGLEEHKAGRVGRKRSIHY